jgi:hypothetical protein
MRAVELGNVEILDILVKNHLQYQLYGKNDKYTSPLKHAIERSDYPMIEYLSNSSLSPWGVGPMWRNNKIPDDIKEILNRSTRRTDYSNPCPWGC